MTDIVPTEFVVMRVSAGRQNWTTDMPVGTLLQQIDRLLRHHHDRLTTEDAEVARVRTELQGMIAVYAPPDPNRTVVYDNPKDTLERTLREAARKVTDRKRVIGELERWRVLLENTAKLTVEMTVDDLAYFRMGTEDLDNEGDE